MDCVYLKKAVGWFGLNKSKIKKNTFSNLNILEVQCVMFFVKFCNPKWTGFRTLILSLEESEGENIIFVVWLSSKSSFDLCSFIDWYDKIYIDLFYDGPLGILKQFWIFFFSKNIIHFHYWNKNIEKNFIATTFKSLSAFNPLNIC